MDFWFNIKIGDALNRSLEVAQVYYQQMEEQAKFNARQISADISRNRLYESDRVEYLKSFINQRRKNYKVGMIETYFDFQKERMVFTDAEHPELTPVNLDPK